MPSKRPTSQEWARANQLVAEGDAMFKDGEYSGAISNYESAKAILPPSSRTYRRAKFYLNQAEVELRDPNPGWFRRRFRRYNRLFWEFNRGKLDLGFDAQNY